MGRAGRESSISTDSASARTNIKSSRPHRSSSFSSSTRMAVPTRNRTLSHPPRTRSSTQHAVSMGRLKEKAVVNHCVHTRSRHGGERGAENTEGPQRQRWARVVPKKGNEVQVRVPVWGTPHLHCIQCRQEPLLRKGLTQRGHHPLTVAVEVLQEVGQEGVRVAIQALQVVVVQEPQRHPKRSLLLHLRQPHPRGTTRHRSGIQAMFLRRRPTPPNAPIYHSGRKCAKTDAQTHTSHTAHRTSHIPHTLPRALLPSTAHTTHHTPPCTATNE